MLTSASPRRLPVPLHKTVAVVGNPAAIAGFSAPSVRRASTPLVARVRNRPIFSAEPGCASYTSDSMPAFCKAIVAAGPAMPLPMMRVVRVRVMTSGSLRPLGLAFRDARPTCVPNRSQGG